MQVVNNSDRFCFKLEVVTEYQIQQKTVELVVVLQRNVKRVLKNLVVIAAQALDDR